ncbi:MAG: response regulator, partial [Bacteroidales bacterium]|nr:response regulator [Bacteroidales bacterium]
DVENVIKNRDGTYTYILPIFKDNKVILNILINVDLNKYISDTYNNYHIGNTIWQTLIDPNEKIIVSNNLSSDSIYYENFDKICNSILDKNVGTINHTVSTKNKKEKILSVYYPIRILSNDFGIVFSLNTKIVISSIIKNSILVGSLTILVLILIIFLFIHFIRKKQISENKIIKAKDTLIHIIESLPIGIMIIDSKRIVLNVNKAALKIFNYDSQEELKGLEISSDFLTKRNFSDDESYAYNENLNQYVFIDDDDNEKILYKKEIPFTLNDKEVSLEAFIDITQIEKARKQEIIANKTKSEFLGKMSHEIRTPLNGIIGMIDILKISKLNDEQTSAINIIDKSSNLLLSVINDILDFSKIEAGKIILEQSPFKITNEIQSAITLYKNDADKKGLEIQSNIDKNVPINIIGDPFRLRQVISNLLENAIKFTFEGKIVISVKLASKNDSIYIIKFSIEDTGIGIPRTKVNEIFNSFTQVNGSSTREFDGSGLGITISKHLVELMNGKIWVESPSGLSSKPRCKGSRFNFTIQIHSNEKLKKDIDIKSVTTFEQIKILIIDDVNKNNSLLYDAYKSFGTNVYFSTIEQNPIKLIQESIGTDEQFHLIIIKDSKNLNGISLLRNMHSKKLTNKFLFTLISSNDKSGNYVKCKLNGGDYYLIKPFEASELFEILIENFTNIAVQNKTLPDINKLNPDIKILLAEDNFINQKVTQTMFKNLGYEIDIAINGQECIEMASKKDYDIIFMDIMMPEKDGLEATKEIRANGNKIFIVALTANAREEDKEKAYKEGMNDYLSKPVKIEDIKKVLVKWFTI